MSAPASHQTISYLGKRFAESGIRLNHRHGQNFLVDLNLLRLIAQRRKSNPKTLCSKWAPVPEHSPHWLLPRPPQW